jgi:hypothetical protein
MAQIHRFRGKVAIHIGDSSTHYLTPDQAEAIGRALIACACDVRSVSFPDSPFTTVNVLGEEPIP